MFWCTFHGVLMKFKFQEIEPHCHLSTLNTLPGFAGSTEIPYQTSKQSGRNSNFVGNCATVRGVMPSCQVVFLTSSSKDLTRIYTYIYILYKLHGCKVQTASTILWTMKQRTVGHSMIHRDLFVLHATAPPFSCNSSTPSDYWKQLLVSPLLYSSTRSAGKPNKVRQITFIWGRDACLEKTASDDAETSYKQRQPLPWIFNLQIL